jgi:hypothetical protein
VLTGLRGEAVDVHEPHDLAGVGVDVGDHHAAVGVGGEHDRAVDRADQIAERRGVGGEAAKRVCRRDHRVTRVEQRIDDGVPARGLGEGAVDENDGGLHEKLLSGWWTASQFSTRVGGRPGAVARGERAVVQLCAEVARRARGSADWAPRRSAHR